MERVYGSPVVVGFILRKRKRRLVHSSWHSLPTPLLGIRTQPSMQLPRPSKFSFALCSLRTRASNPLPKTVPSKHDIDPALVQGQQPSSPNHPAHSFTMPAPDAVVSPLSHAIAHT
jgi:hypothetical protein